MNLSQIYKNLSYTAFGAGLTLLCMLLISIFNPSHITQQHFEMFSTVDVYTNELLASAGILRSILTFDNIFIVLYSASFIFLFMALSHKEKQLHLLIGLIAVLGTGILDFYENHHILSFLTMAEKGAAINADDIAHQMVWSQMKFHLSYLSFFLFAFSMPTDTLLEKVLKYSLLFLQLPVGVLVYTAPENVKPSFELLRYGFMLTGLLLIAYNFNAKRKREFDLQKTFEA
jgi:hypothetical protein